MDMQLLRKCVASLPTAGVVRCTKENAALQLYKGQNMRMSGTPITRTISDKGKPSRQ
jgi:hypothetical protein